MAQQGTRFDILIKDTTIVDGTGSPGFIGSVAIRGDRIVALGDIEGDAARAIDGSGLVTCPGFVDPHSHGDFSILRYPLAENYVMQGITTFVGGNCGFSLAPTGDRRVLDWFGAVPDWKTFDEWLSKVEGTGLSPNYAPLVGHNAIREFVMGEDWHRQATATEVEHMERLVDEAMGCGAFGLSAGLDAAWPGHFAAVEEIITLAEIAGKYGGFYAPHTRHHQNQWPAADPEQFGYGVFHAPVGEIIVGRYHGLLEAVEIARLANVRLHIAHMTPAYLIPQPHPDFLDTAIAQATLADIIDVARDEGLDVTFNAIAWEHSIGAQEPMIASFFSEALALPNWLRAMDKAAFVEGLKSDSFRNKVKEMVYSGVFKFGMLHPLTDPYWFDCYLVLRCAQEAYEGKTLGEIVRQRRPDRIIEAVYDESLATLFDILVEDPDATWALIMDKREYGALSEFFRHPAGMPCTDSRALPADPFAEKDAKPHGVSPTNYGLYPRYLRVFVKEKGVLSLEQAIKKATSLPAQGLLGLEDRGTLREGAYADILIFDLGRIKEGSDYLDPARPPEGIEHVLINGQVVWEGMAHTGARPGRVLRRG